MATIENCKKVLYYIKENPNSCLSNISANTKVHYYQILLIVDFLKETNLIKISENNSNTYVKLNEVEKSET